MNWTKHLYLNNSIDGKLFKYLATAGPLFFMIKDNGAKWWNWSISVIDYTDSGNACIDQGGAKTLKQAKQDACKAARKIARGILHGTSSRK